MTYSEHVLACKSEPSRSWLSKVRALQQTYTQTRRHTDRQTHRHTDTQTHRHTDTQVDKSTNATENITTPHSPVAKVTYRN